VSTPKKKATKKKKKGGRYHRGTHVSPIAGSCNYRSGWEQKYMVYLDENPEVVTWSYEKLIIEYVSNQKTMKVRKYYPDFQVEYIDGSKVVIEIKPLRKLKQLVIVKKSKAAEAWCMSHDMVYKILTEIELKNIGLL